MNISKLFRRLANCFAYDITKIYPDDLDEASLTIARKVRNFTLTSPLRIAALVNAINYIENSRIPGAIVECGVWRGGSMMAAALSLLNRPSIHRELYLYDTFNGMPEPSSLDTSILEEDAQSIWKKLLLTGGGSDWCYCSKDECASNVLSTGYPADRVFFVEGKVEDTIPGSEPSTIALLRIDTDWYESTHHILRCLMPKLAEGGVLIVDDYGYWKGARKAVDEYINSCSEGLLLNRIDDTGRIAVKVKVK